MACTCKLCHTDWRRNISFSLTNAREDEEHDEHPSTANNERLSSAVVLNNVEAVKCRAEVDAVQDHLCDEGVVDAGALEDRRAVVEEVVCTYVANISTHVGQPSICGCYSLTSKLLKHL